MTDEPNPPPNGDDPAPGAADAELIAYLDGELEPAAARRVETRLAADPKLRARADALKRSFDLLDFLPKPEPSPTFATRTLDKLPAVKSSPVGNSVAAPPTTTPVPVPGVGSASLPIILSSASGSLASSRGMPPRPERAWVWAVGLLVAVAVALGAGYAATSAARSYFLPVQQAKDFTADNLPLADIPVVENLPLYAAVDDLDFLHQLAAPEFFGDESVSLEAHPPRHPVEPDKPSGKQLDHLVKVFRELPAERQDQVRQLHRDIQEQDPARRDRSIRVLESYAVWLNALPDADRKDVLAAPNADKRLEAIREARRVQWVASLPAARRQKLKDLPAEGRADLIAQWKAEEEKGRGVWATARANWEAVRTGRPPWPFTDEKMQKEVVAFVRSAYHPDDAKRCRLTTSPEGGDRERLIEAVERAEKGGEWLLLGRMVYDLARNPRYELLPEPGQGKTVTEVEDLWFTARTFYGKKEGPRRKIDPHLGKWPDFALTVLLDVDRSKPMVMPTGFALGPSRPTEFRDDVKRFLPELQKRATTTEWTALKHLEGSWPAYPREMIRLAKVHDLSVPGAMPPGLPSQWEKAYNPPRPVPPKLGK